MSHADHDARMQAGQATLALLEAIEDEHVAEAIDALAQWATITRQRLADHGVHSSSATGSVIGIILTALNE